ncbi:tyrosine-type recombinase/integrase [Pseudomonas corrugata]
MKKLQSISTDGSRLLEFVILTAVRTSEALNASWDEFDLKQAVWTIPADRMKAGVSQRVPLSPRVIDILDQQRKTGAALVFQGRKQGRPLSNMTGLMLLRRMKLGHFPGVRIVVASPNFPEKADRGRKETVRAVLFT